jgi:serine O-acetyltransferase
MDKIIKTDLYRHGGLKGLIGFIRGWFQPGFRYTFFFRLVSKEKNHPLRFLFKLLKRRYRIKYGYEISSNADIGEGFLLSDHCGHTVIGPARIGKYCNIGHNVTIGSTFKRGEPGIPDIGDKVWIGTGAVVVGKIKIGSNVLIAPNSYVNVDVPSNSLVLGNPAVVIKKENPTEHYINYILEEQKSESVHILEYSN